MLRQESVSSLAFRRLGGFGVVRDRGFDVVGGGFCVVGGVGFFGHDVYLFSSPMWMGLLRTLLVLLSKSMCCMASLLWG